MCNFLLIFQLKLIPPTGKLVLIVPLWNSIAVCWTAIEFTLQRVWQLPQAIFDL